MAFADRPDFSEEERSLHNSSSYPESSPDPLALSYNESKRRSKAKRRTRTEPLTTSSGNPQRRQSDMQEHTIDFSSPSKSMIMNTGRAGGGSPWKIKVTVQAEPTGGSDEENMGDGSPTVKRMTRTTTTTVPLRDPDASSPIKRRGRPRKSEGGTPANRKRSGTPAKRRSRKSSVGAVDTSMVDTTADNAPAQPKKRRGRPRKSIQPEEIFAEIQVTPVKELEPEPEQTVNQSAVPGEEELQTSNKPSEHVEPAEAEGADVEDVQGHVPELTPLKARNVRGRQATPAKPKAVLVLTPSASDEDDEPTYEDLTTASQADQQLEDHEEEINDTVNVAPSSPEQDGGPAEGYTMAEGTTIMESENFSMVSVESLPSRKAFSSPASEQVNKSELANRNVSLIERSSLHPPSQSRDGSRSPLRAPNPQPLSDPTPSKTQPSPPKRHQTPDMREESPSAPPAVQYPQIPDRKESSPELAKAVKAGVALQGLLDPTRLTPAASTGVDALEGQRNRLDDLFRGFSDGTRRQLRAGLTLGEQLAKQSVEHQIAKTLPTTTTYKSTAAAPIQRDPFNVPSSQQKENQFRLLTPEEQEHCSPAPPQPTENGDVEYPSLNLRLQQPQLVSPARSVDEMSWRPVTPPTQKAEPETEQFAPSPVIANGDLVQAAQKAPAETEDYTDIWEEEASRSSDLPSERQASRSPQLQDLFPDDGSLPKPARAKLPRTWRRKSSSDFNYSDEAEPEPEQHQGARQTLPSSSTKGKGKAEDPIIIEEEEEEDDEVGTDSDDTGMFWQQNLPAVFQKDRSESDNLDLSMLLGGEQSILKDTTIIQTPQKPTPIQLPPPQLSALQSTPYRNSPLRQQFNPRDLESSDLEESKAVSEVPQSSPFRTQVDDTEPSDVRQLRREIEGKCTESSEVRHLQEQVEAHAYEPHNLTLQDIDEVTEPSRSRMTTVAPPSSPPEVYEKSILDTGRKYRTLFGNGAPASPFKPTLQAVSSPSKAVTPSGESTPETSIWSSSSEYELPPHPAISRFDPLPMCEPWTKTHYKTLDGLFQLYKRKPAMFRPKPGNSNQELLEAFPDHSKYVGARFSSWGYHVTMSGSCVVIAAAFMQLLQLNDIDEYEYLTGKRIQMGDCAPGRGGEEIDAHCIMMRLATVILGEEVRRDEKRGVEIRKEGGMSVQWPK